MRRSLAEYVQTFATIFVVLTCIVGAPGIARAATAGWIGGFDGIWGNASGWSGGVVPNNTQSATYVATVAQAFGQYANVVMTNTTPLVTLDQLHIRNTATVTVGSGSTLRLRDLGAGTTLQRSLVGGGVLTLNGRLDVAINGGVISGSNFIRIVEGRIGGFGRIENVKTITGSGTIGNAVGAFDSGLRIFNIGSAGADPTLTRISANAAGKTLTLGPGDNGGGIGILNRDATLGAQFGGRLVIRGNGSTLDNTNGVVNADVESEVHLANGANLSGGSISGAGTLRIPAGQTAVISNASLGIARTVVEGTAGLHSMTTSAAIDVQGNIATTALTNASTGVIRLLTTAGTGAVQPRLQYVGSTLTNNGKIAGGGTIGGQTLNNANGAIIVADSTVSPLVVEVGSGGLTNNGRLEVVGNARLTLGTPGAAGVITGNGVIFAQTQSGVIDINAPTQMPNGVVWADATINVNAPATFQSVRGVQTFNTNVVVNSSLNVGSVRVRGITAGSNAVTLRAGSGVSRLNGLALSGANAFNLSDNPLIVDPLIQFHQYPQIRDHIVAGRLTGSPGLVLGTAIGNALGLFTWFGEPVNALNVLVLPTLPGDANLDRSVNFADLVRLAQNYNRTSNAVWTDGDSNYDGAVNFADLVALAQHYNQSTPGAVVAEAFGSSFAADWASAQAAVPEPAGMLVLAGLVPVMRRRRSDCVDR